MTAIRGHALLLGLSGAIVFLDQLAVVPRSVLSLRKLISTATLAIRVRRSSDNTEMDIGFTGLVLNTSALATFVGANSGFITKFYDQTGNGRDLLQTTAANQPRIVNAGTYDGKAVFDGTNDGMSIVTPMAATTFVGLYFKTQAPASIASTPMIYELSANFSSSAGTFAMFGFSEGGTSWSGQSNVSAVRRQGYSPTWSSVLTQATLIYDTTKTSASNDEIQMFVAGTKLTPFVGVSAEQTGNYSATQNLFIGCRNNATNFAAMNLETLAIYSADTSAIRTSIEAIVA